MSKKTNFLYYLLNKKEEYSCFNIVHYSFIYLLSTWGITWWLDGCAPTAFSRFSSKEFSSWKNFTIIFLEKNLHILNIQKMVFCFQNWSDLLWEKIGSSDWEKLLKFEAEGWEFALIFEITRTIYSNSERSEQFLVTECFCNLLL